MTSLKLFVLVVCFAGYATAQLGLLQSAANTAIPFARQVLDVMVPKILLLEYNNVPTQEGYRFDYKTSDGSYREERGTIVNPGTEQEELVVMGSFSYNDGEIETITMYTADKNGYRPRVILRRKITVVAFGISSKLLANLSG